MGLFSKSKSSSEKSSIDYSKNPIMMKFLENVQKKEIKNYVLFPDALCFNFTVNGIYCNYGTEIYYKESGYQDLTQPQLKALNEQLLQAVSALPNVKEVKKIRWVTTYTRWIYSSAYGRNIPQKTLRGDFYEVIYQEPVLSSWA